MAQEANIQTVRVQKPYRNTDMGGFDKTWVVSSTGEFIRPTISTRSRSGNHGTDTWMLGLGRYAIISASRPNTTHGPKPYAVTLKCVEVNNGEVKELNSRTMYVMRFGANDLKEWATAICPPS
jgi:hypothetical protein